MLLWLAESAAVAALPEGWVTFGDDEGHPVYYHEKKKLCYATAPRTREIQELCKSIAGFVPEDV